MFNFFQKPAFGLDISDHSVELVSLGGSLKKPELLAMGRVTLEPGITEDGKILQKEKLEISIRDLIKKPQFGKLRSKRFTLAFPESKSFLYIFTVPEKTKKRKIKEEVERRAGQNFPFPLADLYLGWRTQGSEILSVAIQKDTVSEYISLFKKLKIQPIALEIESLSLGRALIEDRKGVTLIADIGARTTNFSIFDDGDLSLSITVKVGGNQFTRVISEKLNISFSEAEELKKKTGLNPEEKGGKVFLILQKEIQMIISEINKINDYFSGKEQKSINNIILAGGSAPLVNLSDYLSDNLGIKVTVGDPWGKINIDILKKKEYLKEALKVNPLLYTTVIGSALRGLTRNPSRGEINLLPKK